MRKITFALGVLTMLIVVGCTQETGPSTATPFIGGSIGLLIDFVEQAPPPEVFDGGDFAFDVEVDLKNVGETFVEKGDVTVQIIGIDPAEFSTTASALKKSPEEDLDPTKKDPDGAIIEGTETFVAFPDLNHEEELSGNTPFTFRANVCYKYQTVANAMMCIKEDLLDTSDTSVCIVNEDKTAFNSGAPVAVTSFKEQASGRDKVSFLFTVEHIGSGDVFKIGQDCDDTVRANENRVLVNVDSGISGLSCSGLSDGTATSGYVTLYSGRRVVRCTQELADRTDYEKPVVITLDYDYEEFVEKGVLVKHVST
ncbi:MAG TPA: hypothetical protein VJI46_07815 [Candidatus Nanoarchaeia archaeon]|nr:hypothetical protein [Candidatus Nanoarchaeia archaeon]